MREEAAAAEEAAKNTEAVAEETDIIKEQTEYPVGTSTESPDVTADIEKDKGEN